MRLLDPRSAYHVWLLLLPLMTGSSWLVCLFVIPAMALAGLALRFYILQTWSTKKPVLHTITYSHFVERVRWAMHRVGFEYEEQQSAGIMGLLMQARTVPRLEIFSQRTTLGSSDDILTYLWANNQDQPEKVEFLAPKPDVIKLEAELQEVLGNQSRRWMYYHLLQTKSLGLAVWGGLEPGVPAWQRWLLPHVYPGLRTLLFKMLKINESTSERCLRKVKMLYDTLDDRLSDGRAYLFSDKLTRADITLASLGAISVWQPKNYTGGRSANLPELDLLPDELRTEIIKLRARPTGKLIAKLYEQERLVIA
eukprot:m.154375 g.154375  ORF g.154375 m.154375 type:complete len:309 (+) comp16382_c0_seq38:90-1016(+)